MTALTLVLGKHSVSASLVHVEEKVSVQAEVRLLGGKSI